jgi:hypothetical protein
MGGIAQTVLLAIRNAVRAPLGRMSRAEPITGPPVKVSAATLFRGAYSVSAAAATNQQLDVAIQWSRPSMAKWYDVYLDTVNPPLTKVSDNQTARVFVPTLALDTTYYLRINSANDLGETAGDVLSFSTWNSDDILLGDDSAPVTDENGEYIETPDA